MVKICPICNQSFTKNPKLSYKLWEKQKCCSPKCGVVIGVSLRKGKHIWEGRQHPRGMLSKTPWNKGKKLHYPVWCKGKKLPCGEKSKSWKGGKYKTQGYVFIYSPTHPRIKNQKKRYVFEHILIAEKNIGRYLEKNEVVHHINGIRNDNRPENIIVMTRAEHLKQHNPLLYRTKEIMEKYWATIRGRTCSICDKPHFGKGYCKLHYKQTYHRKRDWQKKFMQDELEEILCSRSEHFLAYFPYGKE